MRAKRFIGAVAAVAALLVCPLGEKTAKAGGFDELPDQGAQALGRGATFTAKADDATAIYYNVAGLARQRGTKLQLTANVGLNSMSFQRAGNYVDDPKDPATPYGGEKYPLVQNTQPSMMLPMLAATSDFGMDRVTFGLGVFGPAATGRTFPLGVGGKPSPARYDYVSSNTTVIYPTLGAGVRVTEHLDVGLAGHLAVANVDQMSIAYADPGGGACPNAEYRLCDAEGRLTAKGMGAGASVGVMYRASENIQLGSQFRSPMHINANGQTTAKLGGGGPKIAAGPPSPATLAIDMPWILRTGARYIKMEKTSSGAKRELYDLELDATYEAWGSTGKGPTVKTQDPGGLGTGGITTIISTQNWKNTFSLRAGGAYNIALNADASSIFTIRGGAYYDSPTTDSAYTRLSPNTLAKVAGTTGVGFTHGAFGVNLAYAAVFSMSRTVTDGDIRPSNGAKGGASVDGDGKPLAAVNNGDYKAFSHVVSVAVEINFERFFSDRKQVFGDKEYENLYDPAQESSPSKPATDDEIEAKKKASEPVAAAPTQKKEEPAEPPGTWWKPGQADEQLQNYQGVGGSEEAPPPPPPPAKKKKVKHSAKR
jgi:long-chain fatty acid transport protein